jgi:hypothetical protein
MFRHIAIISVVFLVCAKASFSVNCPLIHSDPIDPIVFPGTRSPRVHDFVASTQVRPRSTGVSLLKRTPCFACSVIGDKSAYWFPALLYRFKNGTVRKLNPRNANIHYLFNSTFEKVHPIPVDLRMVVGNPLETGRPANPRFGFTFRNSSGRKITVSMGQFPKSVKNATLMAAFLLFPSCMKSPLILKSRDHKSHVSYPDPKTGKCPAEFPYRIPQMRLTPVYRFPEALTWDRLEDCPLRFMSSKTWFNGYQFYGDIMSAWNRPALKSLITQCATKDTSCKHTMMVPPIRREICTVYARSLPDNQF